VLATATSIHRQPDHRHAFDRVQRDAGAYDLEEPGHDVDLHAHEVERPDDPEQLLVGPARERDDHALDVEQADEVGQVPGHPEHRHVLQPRLPFARGVVDEADEVQAVLRMLEQLPRKGLADVARADDHGVLQVLDPRPAVGTAGCAGARDAGDREDPEEEELGQRGIREPGDVAEREQEPTRDRHEVEHAREVVGGRVVGPLLVPVVEAVLLGRDDPGRHREREDEELARGSEAVRRGGPPAVQKLRERERDDEADDVGSKQRAPDDPAATPQALDPPPSLEDLERAWIELVEDGDRRHHQPLPTVARGAGPHERSSVGTGSSSPS
jgi:hypothetical protein